MRALPAVLLLLQAVISVQTELVAVPVVVTDAHGHHASGLTQDDFRVFEDGRPQPVAVFHHGDGPVTLGLVVDRSQSMRPKSAAVLSVVAAILGSSRPTDELFAVDFNDRVVLALPAGKTFTSDSTELAAAVTAVRAEGRTALYDGVAEGLLYLERGHGEKRALIVLSDGGDNASRRTYADVLALARQSDAVIYAIGLLGADPDDDDEDAGVLKRLCRGTGGVAYFPRTAGQIADVAERIAGDLREQYTLGFTPAVRTDGRLFRKIEVRVTAAGRGRLQVRTRAGYLASDDKGHGETARP